MAILIAEDNKDDLILLKRMLARCALSEPLMVVTDGDEAVAFLKGEGKFADRIAYPLPRLLILNWHLPKVHGLDVLKWMGQQGLEIRNIPVVVLTGEVLSRVESKATASGAIICLVKPLDT